MEGRTPKFTRSHDDHIFIIFWLPYFVVQQHVRFQTSDRFLCNLNLRLFFETSKRKQKLS